MNGQHSTWRSTRVLVTGASGFIGTHLVRRLAELDADVHAASRSTPPEGGVHWHPADLTVQHAVTRLFNEVEPEVVFHLASSVTGTRDSAAVLPITRANLLAAVHLLDAAALSPGTRVVLAGSIEERQVGRESDVPSSPYTAAKWAATGYARMYHGLWGVPATVLRVAMTYGPGQRDSSKLLPHVIRALLAGESPRLSSGAREIDWIYVDDVVDAFLAAGQRPKTAGHVLDIASGKPITIRDTVELVRAMVGPDAPEARYGALPDRKLDATQLAEIAPAAELLGWRPSVPLKLGLRRTVDWYESARQIRANR